MISSPYCAVSGFVFVFVLNLLICYTSVIAYMKFLSPLLRDVTFTNAQWAATSVWDNVEVLLLVIIVWQGYLALIMKKKVSLSQNFYLGCFYIPSCETHKHCRAEIAQYRLEIIFKCQLSSELWNHCHWRRFWPFESEQEVIFAEWTRIYTRENAFSLSEAETFRYWHCLYSRWSLTPENGTSGSGYIVLVQPSNNLI